MVVIGLGKAPGSDHSSCGGSASGMWRQGAVVPVRNWAPVATAGPVEASASVRATRRDEDGARRSPTQLVSWPAAESAAESDVSMSDKA